MGKWQCWLPSGIKVLFLTWCSLVVYIQTCCLCNVGFLLQDYTLSQLRRVQPDHRLPWKPEKFMDEVLSLFLLFALISVISFQVSITVVDQMMAFWVSPPCTLEHVTATPCRDLKEDHQLIIHYSFLWILLSAMLLEDPWFRPKQETKYWVRWTNICLLPEVPCIEFHHRDSLNNMKMSAECVFLCVGYYWTKFSGCGTSEVRVLISQYDIEVYDLGSGSHWES